MLSAACAALCVAAWPVLVLAGTTGKLSGRVVDDKKQPLTGVNVTVTGQRLGAATDADGRYTILNVPAGTFAVRFSLIGYRPAAIENVHLAADLTTKLDATLSESALEMSEVVVSAKRPVVDVGQTGTIATVSHEEIAKLPVQELQDVVNLQAGVVDGHFRGGRIGEVQYQVDGVSVNNAYDNTSSLRLDRSLLEEVQVISGTFDAEYGQAMSGVVNAVLRRGTERFTWDGELYAGQYFFDQAARGIDNVYDPGQIQNMQASLSGPIGLPKTLFLLNGRHAVTNDYVYGTRTFLPTDKSDFENKVYAPTGDGERVPLGYAWEWSGVGKISNRSFSNITVDYQAIVNYLKGRRTNWAYRYLPDGLSRQEQFAIVHGLDWTQTLNKSSYYTVALRQNYLDYKDYAYSDLYDGRYDEAGAPTGDPNLANGAYIQGVDFTRFEQTTNAYVLKGSYVNQNTRESQLKFGGEMQWPTIEFGSPGYLVSTTVNGQPALVRHDNEPPNYPGVTSYHPASGAAFGQEQVEWNDLTLRAGLRADYFDANSTIPSDLANPANSITGAPPSVPQATTVKFSLSPRIGVSYPVSKSAAVFFAYGHFVQIAPLGQIFTNSDYSVLADLAAGGVSYGVLGNPDIRPELTIQYQGGYKQALSDDIGLDINVFYKDVRDLLGVEFIETYNSAEYARLTNVDFGDVIGFTLSFDLRSHGPFSASFDYTWQSAQGNASDPRETATRAAAGEDPRPRRVPFNWDQRNTFNMTLAMNRPGNYSASAVVRVASGQPYTPEITSGFGGGLEDNSGRKPVGTLIDLRGEKQLRLGMVPLSVFMRVFNLLDSRYFNGFVFTSTGSPYYSRSPVNDQAVA